LLHFALQAFAVQSSRLLQPFFCCHQRQIKNIFRVLILTGIETIVWAMIRKIGGGTSPLATICGARTRRGTSCQKRTLANNGRCKLHGGKSTGPRSVSGRARIAQAQIKRWEQWRAKHPRVFQAEVSARQERRIRKAWRDAQKIKKIADEIHHQNELWEAKNRPLLPEQNVVRNAFLEDWHAKATRSETKRWIHYLLDNVRPVRDTSTGATQKQIETGTPTNKTSTEPMQTPHIEEPLVLRQIDRQPIHRIRRLERLERDEQIQAHGRELVERYGLNKRRPTVKVGYADRKRR
jgi:hypothetical protein